MKKIFSILLGLLMFIALVSCGLGGVDRDNDGEHTVTVICSEGVSVISKNPVKVKDGAKAVFTLSYDDSTAIQSVSYGNFNYATKTLTISSVSEDLRVQVVGERVAFDTSLVHPYSFVGTSADASSRRDGEYSLGVRITVSAGLQNRAFVGWSVGDTSERGGRIVSTDSEFTFLTCEDYLANGKITIYANYSDANVMYFDPNGGKINGATANIRNGYYSVSMEGELLRVALNKKYYDFTGCATAFYDDGTFTRRGYVLTEYNTKADGSGEGYSLGSKFPLNLDTATLYCIWSKDSEHSDFVYEDINIPLPDGVSSSSAVHWVSNGIIITEYNGDDETVTIPEMIDGKVVTAIAQGAFKNKNMTTLVLTRRIIKIEDGAFVGCSSLEKIYYPDGIYDINNEAFDEVSWSGVRSFIVNATIAPRFAKTLEGAYAVKLTRFLTSSHKERIVVISGSSSFQGFAAEFLEELLDGRYAVINFGTTRTTHGYMYLEAMGKLADSDDIILFAPENSAYMMGEPRLYWKTLRDMEGMYNIFRYIDISGYSNVLGAFSELNKGSSADAYEKIPTPRYRMPGGRYEDIVTVNNINKYGEYQLSNRKRYVLPDSEYQDVYKITLNNRFKSIKEGHFSTSNPNEDYYTSEKWCDITDPYYKDNMNRAIMNAKAGGARIYFTFCPVDGLKLSEEVKASGDEWFESYDKLIADNYVFDGVLGSSKTYTYNHMYFYNNAFHLNDYGRAYRTYDMYKDICALLGTAVTKSIFAEGEDFEGCLFEKSLDGKPRYSIEEYFEK